MKIGADVGTGALALFVESRMQSLPQGGNIPPWDAEILVSRK